MKTLLIAALLFLSASCAASSAAMDGNELLRECSLGIDRKASEMSSPELVRYIHCAGYLAGVMDMMASGRAFAPTVGFFKACLPKDGVEGEQSTRIVLKFLRANPEMLHQRGDMLIVMAIQKAFPCER